MVSWPDLTFPPLNLWNFPRQPNLYKEHKTMHITLTDTNGEFSIYLKKDFEALDDYVELLVKPVLRAAGFSDAALDQYFLKDEFPPSYWELIPKEEPVEKKAAKKYWE